VGHMSQSSLRQQCSRSQLDLGPTSGGINWPLISSKGNRVELYGRICVGRGWGLKVPPKTLPKNPARPEKSVIILFSSTLRHHCVTLLYNRSDATTSLYYLHSSRCAQQFWQGGVAHSSTCTLSDSKGSFNVTAALPAMAITM